MSSPAYRLRGLMSGTEPIGYGQLYGCSYGGNTYPAVTVPPLYLGSDDLRKKLQVEIAGPQHEKWGIVVGQRTWAEVTRWKVVHRGLRESTVLELKEFFTASGPTV